MFYFPIEDFYTSNNEKSDASILNQDWSEDVALINSDNKYLWNYQRVTFSDNSVFDSKPQIIAEFNANKGNVKDIFNYYGNLEKLQFFEVTLKML